MQPGPDRNHPLRVTLDKLRLLHDYVAVAPLAVPLRSAGGSIFMPDNAGVRERSQRGIVVAVGEGDWNETGSARLPMAIGVGDLAFFGKYAGTEEELGGRAVLVMRESEIRVSVPASTYGVVEHADPKQNHLVDDWCEICHGDPDAEAKARLTAERERLSAERRDVPGVVERMTNSGEIGTGPYHEAKRACPGRDGVLCLYTQTLERAAQGWMWVGARCGHKDLPEDADVAGR